MVVAEGDFVAGGDGWISDESSFYGDAETKDELEQSLVDYSTAVENFRRIQPSLPATVAYTNQANPAQHAKGKTGRYWPMEGNMSARQSTESVVEFVRRLPPSRSNTWDYGDWIWIHNPFVQMKREMDQEALVASGNALLENFKMLKQKLENENASSAVVGRKLTPSRTALVEALKKAAVNAKCLTGKWMLFVSETKLDDVWRAVAQGVADNHLGPFAKVATASADKVDGLRLICVYTKDFTDLKDVKRILDMLVGMGLVDAESRGIYYKCDAYTHLSIDSKNEYGLKASIYGSRDMLQKVAEKKR